MRRIEDNQSGFVAEARGELLPVNAKMWRLEGNTLQHAARQLNRRGIAIVAWVKADNLVAGAHQGGNRRIQRFRRSGGHGHVAVGIGTVAVQLFGFIDDGFAQRGHAGHRRILIGPLRHMICQSLLQIAWAVEIRKPLRQVNRLMLLGQGAHLAKNGRAQ